MNFWELLALTGTSMTILGAFLALYALINNKTLKREEKLTRETLQQTLQQEETLTRETIKETITELNRAIILSDEKTREMILEIGKSITELGRLIVADGEKTREIVRSWKIQSA